jgi:outer membrane protein assembly factor BamE (lipoprotein component of BamABCDE complex)
MGNGLSTIRVSALPRRTLALAGVLVLALAGCSNISQHGYVVPEYAIEQVPVGASKDQVLIALGSPSTTENFGGEAFYYISQTRKQAVAFMPEKVVNQRVLAVYFDENDTVTRIADYGLKDGKAFDFVSRTTPTAGKDEGFLNQVLGGIVGGGGGGSGGGGGPFGGG